MNIFRQLKKDHATVKALMSEVSACDDVEAREKLFATIRTELLSHARAEEQTFYIELEDLDGLEEKIQEARAEHELIENLIKELDQMPKDSDEWAAKFKVFKENVEHHVKEEEGEIFELAHEVFDDEDAEEIGDHMERMETELRTHL